MRKTADEVLAFLDKQRLNATPQNYALGFLYVTGANSALTKAVAEITDGGVRMTQEEAERVMLGCGETSTPVVDAKPDHDADAARMQLLRLVDIASSQSAATSRFGRDLSDGMSQMGENAAGMTAIVAAMIERTATAERELASVMAETDRLRQDLEAARSDANKDALTGLANRRAIDAHLDKLERGGKARTIAFCDVDRFKRVNDTYGHGVGDRVLKMVSGILAEVCGKKAVVGRWGGEEFVVVFEGARLDEAAAIVDEARQTLTSRKFKLRDTDEPLGMISFSAGVATGTGPTTEITGRADALLYRAKDEGRNKVKTE